MDRLLVYRVMDCLTLVILALIGIKVGTIGIGLLVALGIPSLVLLYFTWKGDGAWYRIIAFTALLYSWFYQSITILDGYYALIILAVVSLFLRPPVHFLRTTVYSSWAVALYFFWQNSQGGGSGWQYELFMTFSNMTVYLPLILLLGYLSGLYLNYFEKGYNSQNLYVFVLGIAGAFVLVPFYLFLGGFRGLYQSFYEYWLTFLTKIKIRSKVVGQKLENYLVSTAVEDWKKIWRESFKTNHNTMSLWFGDVRNYFRNYGFILAFYYSLFKLIGIAAVAVTGTVVNVLFSVIYFMILACFMMVYHILRLGFYYCDTFYRKIHRVGMVCPSCYHQDELPVYVCSECQTVHDDLVPNRFGVFKRKCTCGNHMPTSILNGRSELPAQCPKCLSAYKGKESMPIVISIIGGRMAGKTSFWMKSIQQLCKSGLQENGISLQWSSFDQANHFEQLMRKVNAKEAPPATDTMLPKAWNMRLKHNKWAREKMIHLFDPAGDAFDRSDFMKKMEYLSYSDGNILVIDVSSIMPKTTSSPYEQRNSASISPEELIDRLLLYYQEELGMKVHETIGTPLAIVFHKAENGLQQQTVNEVSATREFGTGSHEDCKQWLQVNGFHNLLRKLDHQFTTYRFFTSSAFDKSEELAPAKVMSWILNGSDKSLKLVRKGEG